MTRTLDYDALNTVPLPGAKKRIVELLAKLERIHVSKDGNDALPPLVVALGEQPVPNANAVEALRVAVRRAINTRPINEQDGCFIREYDAIQAVTRRTLGAKITRTKYGQACHWPTYTERLQTTCSRAAVAAEAVIYAVLYESTLTPEARAELKRPWLTAWATPEEV